jgi:putative transposase
MSSNPFRYFKTSPEIIRLTVMLYVRFPLSLRNVEDLLHERGIDVSHETVRYWWNRFGPIFAAEIRHKRARHLRLWSQWRWHLDEAFVRINGKIHYLWRVVDHEGEVLEAYVTKRRDRKAALKFLRKAMKRYGRPNAIVTDKLGSYRPALRTIGNAARQETGRWAQQPGRKLPSAAQTPRTGNAAVPADGNASEIRSRPFIRTQSFQSGAPSLQPQKLQADRAAALAKWRELSAA